MTSNAYIATDGATVMKVGKANNVRRRERQIAIPMTMTLSCIDEEAAFRIESRLRDFVKEKGGIRHQGSVDWFRFDAQSYAMLCEFAQSIDATPVPELDLDTEIWMLVARYHKLLNDEIEAKYEAAQEEIERLCAELEKQAEESERLRSEEREKLLTEIRRLDRENAALKYQLDQLKADDDE